MTTSTATLVSFEESSGLLHELAGAEVSAKQVERAAKALGAEIAAQERKQVSVAVGEGAKMAGPQGPLCHRLMAAETPPVSGISWASRLFAV